MQHEQTPTEHGAAIGEGQQEDTAQQKAETSATPQTAPSTTTKAEDGQRTVASRELALEHKLAAMQAELTRLRAEQTASKTETGNNESISDSDVEILQ